MELTIHGGAGEIGGNKILVRSRGGALFLDFGRNYAREGIYYEQPFLRPRKLEHLLHLGILPDIEGIYKGKEGQSDLQGVVLSHAHTDHWDHVRFLRDDIPVVAGGITRDLIMARECCSNNGLGRMVSWKKKQEPDYSREILEFESSEEGFGDLTVWQHPVDHSIPGAMGTMVDDGDTRLVYTGDIRFHGPRADQSKDFVGKASSLEPDILVVEGTGMQGCHVEGERDVLEKSLHVVERTRGIAMVGYPLLDLDRMATFATIARETGRRLAISMKQAFALQGLRQEGFPPGLEMGELAVFIRDKDRTYAFEDAVMEEWEEVLDSGEVNRDQEELILTFGLFDMNESIEIDPIPGSVYILSSSEPFNEEMWISQDRLKNWLKHLGIPLYQSHASGHAKPHDIREMVREISPRAVVPVHTECPEIFRSFLADLDVQVELPRNDSRMVF
jgi:ribonuclease J